MAICQCTDLRNIAIVAHFDNGKTRGSGVPAGGVIIDASGHADRAYFRFWDRDCLAPAVALRWSDCMIGASMEIDPRGSVTAIHRDGVRRLALPD